MRKSMGDQAENPFEDEPCGAILREMAEADEERADAVSEIGSLRFSRAQSPKDWLPQHGKQLREQEARLSTAEADPERLVDSPVSKVKGPTNFANPLTLIAVGDGAASLESDGDLDNEWGYDGRSGDDEGNEPSGRSRIQINDRQLLDVVDNVMSAVIAANDPPVLFVRGGGAVQIRKDEHGNAYIEGMSKISFGGHANACAKFVTVTARKNGEVVTNVFPPAAVMDHILTTLPRQGELPGLQGIVNTPIVGPDGTLETAPGYLAGPRLFFHAPEPDFALALPKPTPDAVKNALVFLFGHLLEGFPFADNASRAHAMAALLLNFVRPLIAGPTPLHLVEASTRATGKSLLTETIGAVTDAGLAPTTAPHDEAEWRKKITALLRCGPRFIWWDNLEGHVHSESLCAVLTGTVWTDRLLGTSQSLNLPVNCTWMATANNANLHEELVTRSVLIRLDARMEKPEDRRDFKVADPVQYVRLNRAKVVDHALVLVRYWLSQGRPLYQGSASSRYRAWADVMGGLLESVGVPGFLENTRELAGSASPETEVWRNFVRLWGAAKGREKVTVDGFLHDLAFGVSEASRGEMADGVLTELLPADTRSKRRQRLGIALQKQRGRVYGEWKIMYRQERQTFYWLEPTGPTAGAIPLAGLAGPAGLAITKAEQA